MVDSILPVPVLAPVSALGEVQKRFRLMKLSGEIRVIDVAELNPHTQGVNLYKKQEAEMLMRRFLETLAIASNSKQVVSDFWVNPATFVYDAIAFSPLKTPATTLNLWVGHTATPMPGDWSTLKWFLLNIICAGDVTLFIYLLRFLAHMLQRPEEKAGVMIVLLGAQGIGKGAFFHLLHRIWAMTSLQTSDVDAIVGRFNAALEKHYVILMDEALFAGDRKAAEKLKSLITEPQIRIEQKYEPSRSILSFHRFFAASNNDHFAQVDKDDRRFLFLRVSSKKQGATDFFERLFKDINDSVVIGALVHYLLNLHISNFNVRERPKTAEHLRQKLHSLSGFERFWFEVLTTGEIPVPLNVTKQWSVPIFIATRDLINAFKNYDKNAGRYQAVQAQTVADKLARLCPSAVQARKSHNGAQDRGYELPGIEVARANFNKALGANVRWEWVKPDGEGGGVHFALSDLEAMREAYDMDDGTAGPDVDSVLPELTA